MNRNDTKATLSGGVDLQSIIELEATLQSGGLLHKQELSTKRDDGKDG